MDLASFLLGCCAGGIGVLVAEAGALYYLVGRHLPCAIRKMAGGFK